VIEKFSKPSTLTELRSFLGATSYFRKFIAGFSIITSPLNELLREGKFCTPDKWTKEQEQAFETLKEKLKSAPVLSAPRLDRPFIIETDASLKGIASTLLQKDMKGAEHPIAFASKTLKTYQTRYHINELELYAVVFAVKQFRCYIEGNSPTLIRTDNRVICSKMFSMKLPLSGRFTRLILDLQPFNLTFEHRAGRENKFCDYVSRYVNSVEHEVEEKKWQLLSKSEIKIAQTREFSKLIEELREIDEEESNGYKIIDDLLCREDEWN
jgi:hypothetical protein